MRSREFSKFAGVNSKIKDLLAMLVASSTSSDQYRTTMQDLGKNLASGVLEDQPGLAKNEKEVCIVCTVEDADFLAKGVIDGLLAGGVSGSKLHLQCLWNEKIRSGGLSLSPITRQYKEPFDSENVVYVIVKSIISGACVVKTNLTRVLSKAPDVEVFIVSPVLLDGAQERLEREFSADISSRFKYVWFATDFEKDDAEHVFPGIGGSVYERLGFGEDKNKYVPEIVKERREKIFSGGRSVSA